MTSEQSSNKEGGGEDGNICNKREVNVNYSEEVESNAMQL
jgi:hypothetical protein